jgi:hypothetical protein
MSAVVKQMNVNEELFYATGKDLNWVPYSQANLHLISK